MALSTTFTQYAPESTKFGKIMQNKGHFAFHGYSRAPILVPIESSYTTSYQVTNAILPAILHRLRDIAFEMSKIAKWFPFPWDDLRKIFSECQRMANVPNGEKILLKISTG